MQTRKRSLAIIAALVAMVMVSTGCGNGKATTAGTGDAKAEAQSVMLYSSLKESQLAAIKDGFMKKNPTIKMDFYTASTGNVMTKLATEQQAGGIAADLIWVGDPTNYIDFKQQGLLYPDRKSVV